MFPVVFSGLIGVWFARFGFVRNRNRLHGSNGLFITYLVATTVLVAILSITFHGMLHLSPLFVSPLIRPSVTVNSSAVRFRARSSKHSDHANFRLSFVSVCGILI